MPSARIFNIQKYSLHDGPGIRTLVFFKGCPLHCIWCANPESQKSRIQLMHKRALCTNCGKCSLICDAGVHTQPDRQMHKCSACGKCVSNCPNGALSLCGEEKSLNEIMEIILQDKTFYEVSGGGVTIGGGEPLAQPEAVCHLLKLCKAHGLNTAIETCGAVPLENIKLASGITDAGESGAQLADLYLYDLKHMDSVEHRKLTGLGNEQILSNMDWLLTHGANLRVRMPLIPGINVSSEEIIKRKNFLMKYKDLPNFEGIDLLPYHRLGVGKYESLGISYSLPNQEYVPEETLNDWQEILKDFTCRIVRH